MKKQKGEDKAAKRAGRQAAKRAERQTEKLTERQAAKRAPREKAQEAAARRKARRAGELPSVFRRREGRYEASGLIDEAGVALLSYRISLPAFDAGDATLVAKAANGGRGQGAGEHGGGQGVGDAAKAAGTEGVILSASDGSRRAETAPSGLSRKAAAHGRGQGVGDAAKAADTEGVILSASEGSHRAETAPSGLSRKAAARMGRFYAGIAEEIWRGCEEVLFPFARRQYAESDDPHKRFRFPRYLLTVDFSTEEDGDSLCILRRAVLSRRGKTVAERVWREVFSKKSGRPLWPRAERLLAALRPKRLGKSKKKEG